MPTLIADISYAKGTTDTVQQVQMYVIEHVRINKDVDATLFRLQAPKGTKIVKFPEHDGVPPDDDVRPLIEVAKENVDDVASFVQSKDFGASGVPQPPRTTAPASRWKTYAFIVVNLLFFVIVSYELRSRRGKA